MKKYLALLMLMAMAAAPAALAEDAATRLPYDVTFEMDGPAIVEAIGSDAAFSPYDEESDPETGSVYLTNAPLGLGDLTAEYMALDVQRVNSRREPKLSLISAGLSVEGGSIAAFRKALAALTEIYGQPEADPFDESGVEMYVEYGMLDASWVMEDVRISLSLQRMYEEVLEVSFSPRICFDASDLDA